MANPYRWVDDLARQGWLRLMTEAELKVCWAVGVFYNRTVEDARTDARTLQNITGLSHGAFYEARMQLEKKLGLLGLVKGTRRGKFRAYAVTIYRLKSPIPPAPTTRPPRRTDTSSKEGQSMRPPRRTGTHDDTPPRRKNQSAPADKKFRPGGQSFSQTPRQEQRSTPSPTTDSTQLVGEGSSSSRLEVERALRRQLLLQLGVVPEGKVFALILKAGKAVIARPARIDGQAHRVSRLLQASGLLVSEGQVREALRDAAALLDPTTEAAVRIFGGTIEEVNPREADGA